MERYKKRTIALCLASVLTVVGAFGAENYDNALMALKVNVGSGGYVNLTAFTEKPYKNNFKTSKLDDNTYVLTLYNTSNSAAEPDIEDFDNIESIEISTFPYTTESDGYTRVLVKTNGEPKLTASHALFIPDNLKNKFANSMTQDTKTSEVNYEEEQSSTSENTSAETSSDDSAATENDKEVAKNTFTPPDYTKVKTESNSFEHMTVILCISIILVIVGFIYMLSRDKMANVVGDQGDLDINDDTNDKKQSKTKKIRSTINKLDKAYQYKTDSVDFSYNKSEYTTSSDNTSAPVKKETEEENVVVDLDMLYQESQKTANAAPVNEYEENDDDDDLADLLNSFSFEEEKPAETEKEEESFDEELYNRVINSSKLSFTQSDIKKINSLMQTELSLEMADELNKYLNTPKVKPPTQEQILEDLLSTYSIKQNIDFTKEDVDAIRKLMNVEIGPEFVKDFATNPARTKTVAQEITKEAGQKPHKTSEIITLNVKDMLPDLSAELKKHGSKNIKSEAKPTVIYYSEGYEYQKLEVSDDLLNITEADKKHNDYQPSYQAPIVDSGYEVSTLAIKDSLPDLADVKAHPKKYEDNIKSKPKADEKALLKSIANVTFKPFYEEVENEMNQFNNFEVIDSDEERTELPVIEDVLPAINDNEKREDNAAKLLKLIEAQQNERAIKKQAAEDMAAFKKELEAATKKDDTQKPLGLFEYNGKRYTILKSVKCTDNSECRIMQSGNKYIVTGNINNQEIILKQYDSLKNGNVQVRQNDKKDKTKYLVKVDLHKFIISVTENSMEFVMDLC